MLEWALLGDAGFRVRQWTPDKTELEVVDLGSVKAARMTLQPGGGVRSASSRSSVGPGDAYVIEPGHDAWVIGSEAVVGYEFDSKAAEAFARS